MFLEIPANFSYIQRKTTIPETYDGFSITAPPRQCSGNYSGVSLVAQYIESYCYRRKRYIQMKESNITAITTAAYDLDEVYEDNSTVISRSEYNPSLGSVLQACINLGIVNHTTGPGFIQPTVNDIKYFTRQYGGIIVECLLTDNTYSTSSKGIPYEISSIGNVITEDFTKGFIACGYDASYLYVQNNMGLRSGSCGFHKISWSIVPDLVIKGACFALT